MYIGLERQGFSEPWHIEQLNKKVYSVDGFCYYLYLKPELLVSDLDQKSFEVWLEQVFPDSDLLAKGLFEKEQVGLKAFGLWLLNQCPVTRNKSHTEVGAAIDRYIAAPMEERYKRTGDMAFHKRDYRQALIMYRKSQKIHRRGNVANNIGLIYMLAGDYEKASHAFKESLSLDNQAAPRMNLIRLFIQTKAYKEALSELNHVSALHDLTHIWYYYGYVYEKLSMIEESLTAYVRALDEAPNCKTAKSLVAQAIKVKRTDIVTHYLVSRPLADYLSLYIKACMAKGAGQMRKYESCMEAAIESNEEVGTLAMELALHFVAQNQVIPSLAYIEKAASALGESEWVLYGRSQIANAAGDRQSYNKVINQIRDGWKREARQLVQR